MVSSRSPSFSEFPTSIPRIYSLSRLLIIAIYAIGLVAAAPLVAQQPSELQLTVRPHDMLIGQRTAEGGVHAVDSVAEASVYVPTACVGTRRCPLVVFLHQLRDTVDDGIAIQEHLAERYGMILLIIARTESWLEMGKIGRSFVHIPGLPYIPILSEIPRLDAALQYVLRTYAIDPDELALIGDSDGGGYALFLGCNNRAIFSKIAALSPTFFFLGPSATLAPSQARTQVLLAGGLGEQNFFSSAVLAMRTFHQAGQRFDVILGLRGHALDSLDADRTWRWLVHDWPSAVSTPLPSSASTPTVVRDRDLPLLTSEALAKLTHFWTRFVQEPDAIRTVGRLAHQQHITLYVGTQPVQVSMMNLSTLAAAFPRVAADLKRANVTARQADAYRLALISASVHRQASGRLIAAPSVVQRNVAFLKTHREALRTLGATGMWTTP